MEKVNSFGATAENTRAAGIAASRAASATILTSTACARRASGSTVVDSAGSTRLRLPSSRLLELLRFSYQHKRSSASNN